MFAAAISCSIAGANRRPRDTCILAEICSDIHRALPASHHFSETRHTTVLLFCVINA